MRITHDDILKKAKKSNEPLYLTSYGLIEVQHGGCFAYNLGDLELRKQLETEIGSGMDWGDLDADQVMLLIKDGLKTSNKVSIMGYHVTLVKGPKDIREARGHECYYSIGQHDSFEVVDKYQTEAELLSDMAFLAKEKERYAKEVKQWQFLLDSRTKELDDLKIQHTKGKYVNNKTR